MKRDHDDYRDSCLSYEGRPVRRLRQVVSIFDRVGHVIFACELA